MAISYLKTLDNSPIKEVPLWANVSEVESSALDQIRNIATLPWVAKMAIMPDVHMGKGATVGSVIATRGSVSPAAVGVDVGCLDRDTEFLSPEGWIKISEWRGEKVLQFDPETDQSSFIDPLKYIKKDEEYFYHLKHSKGLDQMLCPNHKVLFYDGYDTKDRKYSIHVSKDLVEHHKTLKKGKAGGFLTTFSVNSKKVVNNAVLKVHIMVSADGHIRSSGNCEVHLSKSRKIKRARILLEEAQISYKIYRHKDGTVTYAFVPPFPTKSLSIFYKLSSKALETSVGELFYWDGHTKPNEQRIYYSTDKGNVDAVQYALAAVGIRAGIYKTTYKKDWKPSYQVYTTNNKYVNLPPDSSNSINKVKSMDGKAYCFTVPTGFFVARRNDNIFITGNCGMGAIKTNLVAHKVIKKLKKLREELEKAIPVGFNSHSTDPVKDVTNSKVIKEIKLLKDGFKSLSPEVQGDLDKVMYQLGTLGGGNHFIEFNLDSENNVWLMLHSGSRWIGKTLADIHIKKAMELEHNVGLKDKALAAFLSNTPEMVSYRNDLYWAQKYAMVNRKIMMNFYENCIKKLWPSYKPLEEVWCHHNYVAEEFHYGEKLFVTRKGAINAETGKLGIIPGAMGAKSYIVKGKGCVESLNSAPHGAGRKMSRSKAKQKYTIQDLIKQTKGVECRKDKGIIDEIPSAYKKIEKVIQNSSELVEIVAELQPALVCVKG